MTSLLVGRGGAVHEISIRWPGIHNSTGVQQGLLG